MAEKITNNQPEIMDFKNTPEMVTVKNRLNSIMAVKAEIENSSIDEVKASICLFMNITPHQLGRWINNSTQPTIEEAYNLAACLGKSLNDLIYAV